MRTPAQKPSAPSRAKTQSGLGLVELMMAMAVLLVGLTALLGLCLTAAFSNNKNSKDTSATLLAQMVLEQISAQHPDSTVQLQLTDCANVIHNVAVTGSAVPGTGANLDNNQANFTYGMIDWSQPATAVTPSYAMTYTDCDTNGRQTNYDVRWNIITIQANDTRLITVSARQMSPWATTTGGDGVHFALPVTLRGVGGP